MQPPLFRLKPLNDHKWKAVLPLATVLAGSLVLGYSVATGRLLTVFGIMACVLVIYSMAVARRFGATTLLYGLLLFFWLPVEPPRFSGSIVFSQFFLVEMGIWLLCLHTVANRIMGRHQLLPQANSSTRVAWGLIIGGAVIALLVSDLSGIAIFRVRLAFLYPLALYAVCMTYLTDLAKARHAMGVVLASTGILSMMLLVSWRSGLVEFSANSLEGGRLGVSAAIPITGLRWVFEPADTATQLGMVLPIALAFLLCERSFLTRATLVLIIGAVGGAVIMMQGRGGWISTVLGCTVVLGLSWAKMHPWDILKSAALCAVLLLGGVVLYRFAFGSGLNPLLEQRVLQLLDPLSTPNFVGRIEQYKNGWNLFLQYPLGINLAELGRPENYVHSTLLTYLLGAGVLGLSGILVFLAAFLRRQLRALLALGSSRLQYQFAVAGLGMVTVWFVGGLTEAVGIYFHWGIGLVWLSFSICMAAATVSTTRK